MENDKPPPYVPQAPGGPSAPGYPAALSAQPQAFPGMPYQTFPQTYTGGGDQTYYHGPPGPPGPPGPYVTQPGYQGYQSGPPGTSGPWDGPKMYGEQPKHTVFLVERTPEEDDGGGDVLGACLAGCQTALCCCCLYDLLS